MIEPAHRYVAEFRIKEWLNGAKTYVQKGNRRIIDKVYKIREILS